MTTLFSDNAPGKSTGRTSDGNMADHAGAFSALPTPTPSAARKRCAGDGFRANARDRFCCGKQ